MPILSVCPVTHGEYRCSVIEACAWRGGDVSVGHARRAGLRHAATLPRGPRRHYPSALPIIPPGPVNCTYSHLKHRSSKSKYIIFLSLPNPTKRGWRELRRKLVTDRDSNEILSSNRCALLRPRSKFIVRQAD